MELQKYNCTSCGAVLDLIYGAGKIICPYCGTPYQVVRGGGEQNSYSNNSSKIEDNPAEVIYQIVPMPVIDIINPKNTFQNRPVIPGNTIGFFQGNSRTKLFLPYDTTEIIDRQMALFLPISYITGLELPLRFRMVREGYSRSFLDKKRILDEKHSEFWVNDFEHYKMKFGEVLLPHLDKSTEPLFKGTGTEIMTEAENYLKKRYGFSFVALPKQEYAGFEDVKSKNGILATNVKVFRKYIYHFYKESIGTVMLTTEISRQLLESKTRFYIDKLKENTVIDQIADGIARLIYNVDTNSYRRGSHYIQVTSNQIVCGGIRYDDEHEHNNFYSVSILHCGKSYGFDTFNFKSYGMQDVNEPKLRIAIQSVIVSRIVEKIGEMGMPYNIEHAVYDSIELLKKNDYYPIVKISPATAISKKYDKWV